MLRGTCLLAKVEDFCMLGFYAAMLYLTLSCGQWKDLQFHTTIISISPFLQFRCGLYGPFSELWEGEPDGEHSYSCLAGPFYHSCSHLPHPLERRNGLYQPQYSDI